jgi:hypothetical protein
MVAPRSLGRLRGHEEGEGEYGAAEIWRRFGKGAQLWVCGEESGFGFGATVVRKVVDGWVAIIFIKVDRVQGSVRCDAIPRGLRRRQQQRQRRQGEKKKLGSLADTAS